MAFTVGMKCVCIDDQNGDAASKFGAGRANGLRIGAIYTINRIKSYSDGDVSLFFNEVYGGWFKERFRPAVERKTDISVFKAMLKPNRVNA